jgi:uncharacterized protein YjbJ (UPF0337 family)
MAMVKREEVHIVAKAKNSAQNVKGKLKEVAGKSVGNDRLRVKGKNDQTKGNAKQAGQKIKDTLES